MDYSQTEQQNDFGSTDILLNNQILISKIFTSQCNSDFETSTNLLQLLMPQMNQALQMCAQHPKSIQVIREYREILPEHCIQQTENTLDEGMERYYKYLERVVNQQNLGEKKQDKKKNPWTEDERKLFEEALNRCEPKDWKQISAFIKTRSPQQVRSHFQKYEKKLRKQQVNKRK